MHFSHIPKCMAARAGRGNFEAKGVVEDLALALDIALSAAELIASAVVGSRRGEIGKDFVDRFGIGEYVNDSLALDERGEQDLLIKRGGHVDASVTDPVLRRV